MLKSLNPEQIEAMTVLKDKEATALYGERGKNGVILVTLKKEQQPASESDISLVFIDGKEVSREKLKHLDSEQIETVTVLKDKESTAAYGEKGKNGVMLITLKKEQQPDASNAPVAKLPQGQDPVYEVCEVLPEFPGGMSEMMKFVQENMKYPQEAHANGVQGRVIVNYIVEKDGSLSNIHVVRSVDPLLDAEALRVVSLMPKWKPGKQDGKPVRVKFTIPITFKLQG
ncbi:MAG: TonB family protein [Prevotella sp.]|nr:TonB family protein [Prevotella sp.]